MIPRTQSFIRAHLTASLALGASLLLLGCGEGDSTHRPAAAGPTRVVGTLPSATKCEDGTEQECGVTLRQSGGIITCFQGTQICEDGTWGICTDGDVSVDDKDASFLVGRDFEIQALSNAAANDCKDDCDPKCLHVMEEPPDLGETGSGGSTSGGMPATPPSFPGQAQQAACDHDVCSQGAALDVGCDACVTEICTNHDSSCCSSSWDDDCIDLVYTVCLGETPPASLCDFGLFAESTITTANRPSSGASIGANGNVTIGTDATPGKIVTKGNLRINSPNGATVTIPEGVWVGGDVYIQAGSTTTYKANFNVGGGIDLTSGNIITGNAYARTNITAQNNTAKINGNAYAGGTIGTYPVVSGSKNNGSGHAPPSISIPAAIPDLPRTCPGGTSYTIDNGTRTLTPGNYGSIKMQNGAKLVLNGQGTYTFTNIDAGSLNGGGIQIGTTAPSTPGGYNVTVCGDLTFGNNVNIINYSANPTDYNSKTPVLSNSKYLVTYVGGNAKFGTDGKWVGVMIVPNGSFTSSTRTNVTGAIWSSSVNADTDLNAVGISASDCNSMNIPGIAGGSVECAIENVTTGVPPSAVEPCETGADCQINQRCDEVTTSDECAHDKCVWGEALDATCDSCVGRICLEAPECCSDEWTHECAEMVATVCDATCGAPTAPICWHDVCEEGEGLAIGCDASEDDCTTTICKGAFAYCCDTSDPAGWDDDCIEQAALQCSGSGASGPTLCDYTVKWGTTYAKGGATVTPNTSTNTLAVTDKVITCGSGTTTINSNTTRSAGTYGTLAVNGWGTTLTLNPGTYFVSNLTLASGSILNVPTGKVVLNVCGNITLAQDAKITGLANNSALLGLQIYLEGNFTAGPQATSRGVLIASNSASTIKLDGPTTHTGHIWSNGKVEFTNNWGANPTVTNPIVKADCVASGLVSTTPVCDVVTPVGEVANAGICVSNTDGWTEPYCSGFDLAADYVCDTDVIPICNHGATQFSGYVEVGYWEAGEGQFSTSTPDTSASSYDTCGDTLTIAPGACEDLDCPVPSAGDYTYMVDPEGTLSECNDSRLDNWTWKDGDFVCPVTDDGLGGITIVEYEYLADCPGDTVPGWKNLTWKTSVPSGSTITFRAQVVQKVGDIDPEGYKDMGVAQPGTPDTTNCQLGGPKPECPVPLTDKLDLTVNQGRILALQIETDHSGGTPTVEDWVVSYTCRYDQ